MEQKKNEAGSDVIIRISGLKKRYRLGVISAGTLQGEIKERIERRRRKREGEPTTSQNRFLYALDGVDLTVHRGEALGIIGRNGAGKSTLLKIISRITAPTEGCVDLYGRITSMLEVGTGFHGDMTGRENIYLNGAILGMTRAEIDEKIDDIIRFAELEEFIDTPVKRYSSGMYVKLGFSVAFHLDSEIIIMDEVLAVGDVEFQRKCIDSLLSTARRDDRTILYVSHNMNTIRRLCDRCVVLDRGRVIFDGDVDRAISAYLGVKDQMLSEIEYGPMHRPDDYLIRAKKRFSMEKLTLTDRSEPSYHGLETALLDLKCTAECELKQVGFRFEFWNQSGSKIATTLPGNFLDFPPGEATVRIALPLGRFVSGRYTADIIAFQLIGQGEEFKIDAVYPGFSFDVEQTPDVHNYMEWQTQYWGSIRLDDLSLTLFPEMPVET